VDTLPGVHKAHNHARTSLGFPPWSKEEFSLNTTYSARELYPRIYGERAAEAMDILYKYVDENHLDYLHVMPHAARLLQFIRGQDILIGLVSNKRHEYLLREVEHLGWSDLFYCILGAGVAARDKPAGDPITMALEKATAPLHASRAWFVGDTVTDLLAAAAAGCPSVLITHGQDRSELVAVHKPLIVAEDCLNLLEIIFDVLGASPEISAC
jgi:phosphoglycolate phosphatase